MLIGTNTAGLDDDILCIDKNVIERVDLNSFKLLGLCPGNKLTTRQCAIDISNLNAS